MIEVCKFRQIASLAYELIATTVISTPNVQILIKLTHSDGTRDVAGKERTWVGGPVVGTGHDGARWRRFCSTLRVRLQVHQRPDEGQVARQFDVLALITSEQLGWKQTLAETYRL